jgi:hypothetical protein
MENFTRAKKEQRLLSSVERAFQAPMRASLDLSWIAVSPGERRLFELPQKRGVPIARLYHKTVRR